MLVKTVLWTRATILLLLGVAIIVSTFYKGHTEPETETEKKATTILLSLVVLFAIAETRHKDYGFR